MVGGATRMPAVRRFVENMTVSAAFGGNNQRECVKAMGKNCLHVCLPGACYRPVALFRHPLTPLLSAHATRAAVDGGPQNMKLFELSAARPS
jgi:hypothetical protein